MNKKCLLFLVLFFSIGLIFSNTQLNQQEVIKQTDSVTKEKYPNDHSVLVNDLMVYDFEEDGTGLETDDVYIKVLDQKGKKGNSVQRFGYDRNYSDFKIKKVEIIKKSGKVKEINIKKNIKDQVSPSQARMNIYEKSSRLITLQVPGLEVGDTLHYYTEEKIKKSRIKGEFSFFELSEYTNSIKNYKVVVKGPKTNPFEHFVVLSKIKNKFKKYKKTTENENIYIFEANDVDKIMKEPSMPSIANIGMRVLGTTVKSWEDISKWYYNLTESKMNTTKEMKKKAKELVKNKESDREKIKEIFKFVQTIRYMGAAKEENRPGLEPHKVSYTFENKIGVCRDKAALIAAMLRSLGYESHMVLINASRKLDKEVPITYFNHAIAQVTLKNGEKILLDPTVETSKKFLPAWEMDKTYLVATKEGETLKTTPVIPAKKNQLVVDTEISYEENKFKCISKIKYFGVNDQVYRRLFLRRNKQQTEDFITKTLKKISDTANLIDYEIKPLNLRSSDKNIELKLEFSLKNLIVENNNYGMFQIPTLSNSYGIINFILRPTKLDKRNYPLKLPTTASIKETTKFKYKGQDIDYIKLPNKININNTGFNYKTNFINNSDILIVKRYFALDKINFDIKEYNQLKENLKKIENYENKYIIFKK